mmetsp:Transcript_8111/g.12713  ORF Transcript_8111/g.12713 Transcript_8111/m.12713 type:complete len:523 (+) Transcript_8111:58-1626(+)|eukprot:CAMPEP_0201729514 /NCGR_PEP_ID=MMETSP0593-20130828/19318_1 /ASSEMBLY_ACC=CAM_ASM_000672 /TAXON_ID=267983 /ORGANISM="Skeletonema japonicum, Strain CCMP2506" /LENGTH=522 /DNA_ID=CAMNT_0048221871 /DNA_START=27 /DNA_END=1595 /DNA_ORIENTATION=+
MNIPQAFDIPLPKTGKTPPPVAKRLANTPRNNSPSSLEIKEKLDKAAAKREELLQPHLAKLSAHSAEVERARNDFETRKREEAEALREASRAKQDNAVAKRENERLSWVQKIAAATNHKLAKGRASLEASQMKARELEVSLEQKIANAEMKREQLQMENVEELKSANDEKLKRGQNALALSRAESRRLESKIENKIADATSRKEKNLNEKVNDISSKTEAKIVRGKIALSTQNKLAKETMQHSWKKLDAANERRESLVRDQVELLRTVSTKKEERIIEKQNQDSNASKALQKNLSAKLSTAELARDEHLKAKVKKAAADDLARVDKAKAVALKEVKLQKAMGEVVQDKLNAANERREVLMRDQKEAMNKLSLSKNSQSPRRLSSSLTVVTIEEKLNSAAERRESFLAARSSSSKRAHSPRGPSASLTVDTIEEKLNSAAERRDIYLKNRVSKISSKSSPISKTLSFASVSPDNASPRIKAARLDARSKAEVETVPTFTPWLLSSFAVAILGMVAFARFSSAK